MLYTSDVERKRFIKRHRFLTNLFNDIYNNACINVSQHIRKRWGQIIVYLNCIVKKIWLKSMVRNSTRWKTWFDFSVFANMFDIQCQNLSVNEKTSVGSLTAGVIVEFLQQTIRYLAMDDTDQNSYCDTSISSSSSATT